MLLRQNTTLALIAAFGSATLMAGHAVAQEKSIVVSSTTSTQDSGLFEYLLPIFKQKTGIAVKVIAQGTGQALDTGRRGDADVVFVHAKSAEQKFLAEGEGVKRYPVMYNDFVLIGPKSDPAGIKGMKDVAQALRQIKDKQAPSYRVEIDQALTSPNSRFGTRTLVSISRKKRARGTSRLVRAWVPHSIWRTLATPMYFLIEAHGFLSRIRETFKSLSRRQAAVQSIWRHAGKPGQAPERKEGPRSRVH